MENAAQLEPQPASIPIALVDDHLMVRRGIIDMLQEVGGYETIVQAGNGEELIVAMRARPPIQLALIDLSMPLMNGFETLRWMKKHHPAVRCVVITYDMVDHAVTLAMRNGARGYLLKAIDAEDLKMALDTVMRTGYYHDEFLNNSLLAGMERMGTHELARAAILAQVTDREKEFLRLLCDPAELTYEAIATRMQVTANTAHGYRKALFERFGIQSKTGLVLFAIKWGIVQV